MENFEDCEKNPTKIRRKGTGKREDILNVNKAPHPVVYFLPEESEWYEISGNFL